VNFLEDEIVNKAIVFNFKQLNGGPQCCVCEEINTEWLPNGRGKMLVNRWDYFKSSVPAVGWWYDAKKLKQPIELVFNPTELTNIAPGVLGERAYKIIAPSNVSLTAPEFSESPVGKLFYSEKSKLSAYKEAVDMMVAQHKALITDMQASAFGEISEDLYGRVLGMFEYYEKIRSRTAEGSKSKKTEVKGKTL